MTQANPLADYPPCPTCHGTGNTGILRWRLANWRTFRRTGYWRVRRADRCPTCGGTGLAPTPPDSPVTSFR